MDFDS